MQESEIRIDKEGIWYFRGAHMFRKEFLCIFFENLKIDADGKYLIELGEEQCYLDVEDTAFVVISVFKTRNQGEGCDHFHILLTDDSIEKLDLNTLQIGCNNVPYCMVKNSKFKARFSRKSYYQLAEHIEQSADGKEFFVTLNDEKFYIHKD